MILHAAPILEVRSMPEGVIEGLASSFGGIDSYGDTVAPGAFSKTLQDHAATGTTPPMLWAHEKSAPVGRWEQVFEDARGLRVVGRLNLKTTAGRDAFEHLHAGDVAGLSIGFTIPPGGAEQRDDVRLLRSVRLHEVSLVTLAADAGARITSVKSAIAKPESLRESQTSLQSLGFSRREAARIAQKGYGDFDAVPEEAQITEDELLAIHTALRSINQTFKGK